MAVNLISRGRRLRPGLAALAVCAALAAPAPPAAGVAVQAQANEAAVQAAFIFNFARFIEWPGTPATAFNFCLAGSRPALAGALQPLAGRSVQGRVAQFVPITRPDELRGCQVLFVADAEAQRAQALLQAAAGLPVLTVSDSEGFARRGGMIGLLRVGDKLRFEINRAQAQQVGLKPAADLLNLAVHVFDTPVRPGEELR